jgi:hypothetical protein
MKSRCVLVLVLAWIATVCGAEQPLTGARLAEKGTDDLRLSAITISINEPGPQAVYPAPKNIMFLPQGAELEPIAFDASGVPLSLVFSLKDENLAWIRGALNDELTPARIERFVGVAWAGSRHPKPDYPDLAKRPAAPVTGALEIRATAVFRDAYYIDEFIVIETATRAAVFLETLAKRFDHPEIAKGLQRLAENLMSGEIARRTAPPRVIPPPPKVVP